MGSGELFTDDCGLLLGSYGELEETHAAQLSELEKNYKAALKAEKLAAQDKLGTVGTWENDPDEGVAADPADLGQRNTHGHGWTLPRLSRFPSQAQEEQVVENETEKRETMSSNVLPTPRSLKGLWPSFGV